MAFGQTSGKDENERRALARGVVRAGAAIAAAVAVSAGMVAASASASASALQHGCKVFHPPIIHCVYHQHGQTEFTVPQHVVFIRVWTVGARGGHGGGLGAVATGVIRVHPGEHLYANVNVLGGAGGRVKDVPDPDLAGGGESDIRTCSVTAPTCASGGTLESRLLIAGGGGGSGRPAPGDYNGFPQGGNAGTLDTCTGSLSAADKCDAQNGLPYRTRFEEGLGINGGTGAMLLCCTNEGHGRAGTGGRGNVPPGQDGGNGALGAGGHGGNTSWDRATGGGGGGAGWYGGGGGGATTQWKNVSAGGGGGTSHAAPGVTHTDFTQATADEQPAVTLRYAPASVH